MSGRRNAKTARGLLYYLGLGVSAGILAFIVLVGVLVIVIPAVSGATPMTILTRSMEPTYPPGTLIIVRPTAAEEVKIGDALTYQLKSGEPAVVTHRVIAISTSSSGELAFTTKGDNNAKADELPVRPVQFEKQGTVWYSVPWIGYLNNLISGDARQFVIPVLVVLLFVYAGYAFASGIATTARKRRRERAKEQSGLVNGPAPLG